MIRVVFVCSHTFRTILKRRLKNRLQLILTEGYIIKFIEISTNYYAQKHTTKHRQFRHVPHLSMKSPRPVDHLYSITIKRDNYDLAITELCNAGDSRAVTFEITKIG